MKRLFFIFLIFSGFLSLPAWAANTDQKMKLVFPFGEKERHHSSICDINYRTLDGCCTPPDTVYMHDKRVGCCHHPNLLLTVGSTTRCCTSTAANQTRFGQTENSPCGQFCTLPNEFFSSFGTSSCCAGCTGVRWNQTAANICGDCCVGTSSVLYVGAYSSCCAALPAGQTRFGQTASSVCGGYCPPARSVYSYSGLTSCCASCSEVIAFQSDTNVCGTCCSRIPESCGSAGIRVCEPITGSAYCSQKSACNHPDEWLIGSSGEGGYTCCASCTGTRYNQTLSNCGACCPAASQTVTYGDATSCCTEQSSNQTRWNQTDTNVCGSLCTQPSNVVTYDGYSSCCASCDGMRYGQTAASVCGNCCPVTNQMVTYSHATGCCPRPTASQVRWGQTEDSPCGQFCTQPSNIVTYSGYSSCCKSFQMSFSRLYQTENSVCGCAVLLSDLQKEITSDCHFAVHKFGAKSKKPRVSIDKSRVSIDIH